MKKSIVSWVIPSLLIITTASCVAAATGGTNGRDDAQPSSPTATEQANRASYEVVSRAYRVKGNIENVVADDHHLKSLTVHVTQNMAMANNPVDVDLVGQTLDVQFVENPELDAKTLERFKIERFKKGTQIVIAVEQVALSDGKVVFASYPEWVYFVVNGSYEDLQGKAVPANDLQP